MEKEPQLSGAEAREVLEREFGIVFDAKEEEEKEDVVREISRTEFFTRLEGAIEKVAIEIEVLAQKHRQKQLKAISFNGTLEEARRAERRGMRIVYNEINGNILDFDATEKGIAGFIKEPNPWLEAYEERQRKKNE